MKRVVVHSNIIWTIANFRKYLIKQLVDDGYEVICIADYDDFSEQSENILKALNVKFIRVKLHRKGINPFEDLKYAYDLYKIYKDIKPDIVLHFTIKPNLYGTLVASLLKIKSINNIAGLGTLFIKESFSTKVAKSLYKFSQTKATKIFFQNRDDYTLFIDQKLVDKNKCDILPGSGVNIERFKPMVVEKKDNLFRFILIARLLWTKGVGEYIEATKIIKHKYPDIECQLVGFFDKENKSAISKEQVTLWEKEGLINYLGASDDIRSIIAEADCVVYPSYYREGTPKTLLEAASMEKPIITTDNVGCRDVVDDGETGYLCEVKNVDDLVRKMEKIINLTREERNEMGQKGRRKMKKEFDEKIVINKYLKSIQEALS